MIEVFANSDAAASAAAAAVERALRTALVQRGRATFVATGGRSPGPVYDRLAAAELDWSRVAVTLSDERCVAPDAAESNARLVRERLLTGRAAAASFVPLWAGATTAESAIHALLPFDVVMLGMGEDGHIASLFAASPAYEKAMIPDAEAVLAAVPAGVGDPPIARVTLTLSALLRARAVLIFISGETKRRVLHRAEAGEAFPVAALLRQTATPVRVFWSP